MSFIKRLKGIPAPSSNKKRPRDAGIGLPEPLESRVHLSASYRSIDGTGNNLSHNTWGSAGTDLVRMTAAAYADGVSSPSLPNDLSARAISNILNNQVDPANPGQDLNTLDQNNLSDFGYAFGQFIDHDMDLTPDGGSEMDIPVAATDPIGPGNIPFTRSQYDTATGVSNPRQQVNAITSYLDLSQVYGSDAATASALRTMTGGLLKTSPGNLLPYDNSTYFTAAQLSAINASVGGMANEGGAPTASLFVTGDTRGNENLELTALETLFVRNHNLIAGKLQQTHPNWTDEQLYQEARMINIAGYQAIIYNEWLPAVFGSNALPNYAGYNPNVNVSIANEFSTVAFRFGHSMVSPTIARQDNNGLNVTDEVPLTEDFFDPNLLSATSSVDPYTGLTSTDIGPVLKADADGNGQAMDTLAVSAIRNLLFGDFGAGGDDLIARDVQRGRDNGIGDYNSLRVALGLKAVTSFAQITSNVTVQQELAAAYPGGVSTIDAFEGGVAEDHVPGSDVGPLFQAIMVTQFARLRDGDRFFYQNENLNPEEMNLFQQSNSLSKVMTANTGITNLQSNVMIFTASISGQVIMSGGTSRVAGAPAINVSLLDSDGDVMGTTTTDGAGRYSFNQQTGVEGTGMYTVTLTLPSGATQTSGPTSALLISRGDLNIAGVNFGLQGLPPAQKPAPPPPPPVAPPPPPPRASSGSPNQPASSNTIGSVAAGISQLNAGAGASATNAPISAMTLQGSIASQPY